MDRFVFRDTYSYLSVFKNKLYFNFSRLITDYENKLEQPLHPKLNANILEILTFR